MSKTLVHLLKWPAAAARRHKLYKIDEVAEYQRSNPFIRTGYRGNMSVLHCLQSTLALHNETMNIWTHLFGFAIFSALLVRDLMLIPYHQVSFADVFVLTGLLVCYQLCMMLSSLYHTLSCHSQHVSDRCLSLDLAGITLALLATYLSGIYYAFWCLPHWRDFYLLTVGGIFLLAAGMQLSPKSRHDDYAHVRIGLFSAWAVYGLIPTVHWVWLHGGLNDDRGLVPLMLPRIFVMYAICGVAFVFYISKMPERLVPGLVDIVGHSHQWWHVFIFLALLFWHHTGVNFALFRISHGCDRADEEAVARLGMWPPF